MSVESYMYTNLALPGGPVLLSMRKQAGMIGGFVWHSAEVLSGFLQVCVRCVADVRVAAARQIASFVTTQGLPSDFFASRKVLELGSGTGLCGIVAARLGAWSIDHLCPMVCACRGFPCHVAGAKHVIVTDTADHLELLSSNVAANCGSQSVAAVTYAWCVLCCRRAPPSTWSIALCYCRGEPVPPEIAAIAPLDVIIGADITYGDDSYEALVSSLTALTDSHTKVLLLCSLCDLCCPLCDVLFLQRHCRFFWAWSAVNATSCASLPSSLPQGLSISKWTTGLGVLGRRCCLCGGVRFRDVVPKGVTSESWLWS